MIQKGIYEHYKGHKYQVLDVAVYEPTMEPVVIYEALYNNEVSKLWVRPEEEFSGMVNIDGELIPRFKKVD